MAYQQQQLDWRTAVTELDTLAGHIDTEGALQEDDEVMLTLRAYAKSLASMAALLDTICQAA